ncbi:hypothetical protein [Cytobacillus firmus]|uniref:hypothetical protein n=1 Tax=Cytobacillus firmus TaxID=1399 RepID=UPI0018CF57DD|nr:hypothetical protein [Cytobacillus firmus]MBG9657786.1 hypothetical protein [Cytobacillus firmus]MED1904780.1 hypothetical protein [Cytobacillus firmus]
MGLNLTDIKTLAVKELCYSCLIEDSVTEIPKPNFDLSIGKLAVGIGRTIISQNINSNNKRYIVLSSLYLLKAIISNSETKLLLLGEAKKYLRDFSLSGRVGEIAQGINYLFFQERLNFIEIVDFKIFVRRYINKYPKGSPDFIMTSVPGNNVILESKGNWTNYPRTNLKNSVKSGLEQCEKGYAWLNSNLYSISISKFYTSVVRLKDDNTRWTELIYVDPEYSNIENKQKEITFLHFSTWFYFIGLEGIAERLKDFKNIRSIDVENLTFNEESILGDDFILFDIEATKENYLSCLFACDAQKARFQFGMSKKVWNCLFDIADYKDNTRNTIYDLKPYSGKGLDLFKDGTLIRYK